MALFIQIVLDNKNTKQHEFENKLKQIVIGKNQFVRFIDFDEGNLDLIQEIQPLIPPFDSSNAQLHDN